MIPYFSYNLKDEGDLVGSAELKNYVLYSRDSIREKDGGVCKGNLFKFNEKDWEEMDQKKGERFVRISVKVSFWGESVQAETYITKENLASTEEI